MNRIALIGLMACCSAVVASSQQKTRATAAEIAAWNEHSESLEATPCRKLVWLLNQERDVQRTDFSDAIGWSGRGFVIGAAYVLGVDAQKKAGDFGLSANVVAAHVTTFCDGHDTAIVSAAFEDLLLKVLK